MLCHLILTCCWRSSAISQEPTLLTISKSPNLSKARESKSCRWHYHHWRKPNRDICQPCETRFPSWTMWTEGGQWAAGGGRLHMRWNHIWALLMCACGNTCPTRTSVCLCFYEKVRIRKWDRRITCSFCPVVFSWNKSCLVEEVCCWVSALLRWPTFLCSGGPSRQHLNSRATQRVSLLLQRFEKFIWGRSVCSWNLPSWCRKVTLRCPLSCFLILRVLKPVLAGFIANFFRCRLFLCAC